MRRLGQHFLQDKRIIARMIRALDLRRGEVIVEIGPGHGELTLPLLTAIQSNGCRLVAVEKDGALAHALKTRCDENREASIVHGDIRSFLPEFASAQPGNESYKLIGNLPYYLTGFLLRIMGALSHKPTLSVFTIQKEVALRLGAKPPRMNRLAASVAPWAETSVVATIPPRAFSPPPAVHSSLITLRTISWSLPVSQKKYEAALHLLFAHPRKTILGNLKLGTDLGPEEIKEKLNALHLPLTLRPHDLSPGTLARIADVFVAE